LQDRGRGSEVHESAAVVMSGGGRVAAADASDGRGKFVGPPVVVVGG
jgi:hypothetical protein